MSELERGKRTLRLDTLNRVLAVFGKTLGLVVFTWWVGNGDLHLKNYSLIATHDGRQVLSPAYDQLCSRLVTPGDAQALPIAGIREGLRRTTWLQFGSYCGLPDAAAKRVLSELADTLTQALAMVQRSALPDDMKRDYADLLRARARMLAGPRRPLTRA